MEIFDVTKAAFISTSRENWLMLKKVNKDDTYKIIQALADYILDGKEPNCDNCDVVSIVTEQFKSVIDRKGQKSRNSVSNFRKNPTKEELGNKMIDALNEEKKIQHTYESDMENAQALYRAGRENDAYLIINQMRLKYQKEHDELVKEMKGE